MSKAGSLSSADLLVRKGHEDLYSAARKKRIEELTKCFQEAEGFEAFLTKFENLLRHNEKMQKDLGEVSIKLASLMEQKAGFLGLDIGNSQINQAMVVILKQVSSLQKEKIAPCHAEHGNVVLSNFMRPLNEFTVEYANTKEQLSVYLEARSAFVNASSKVRTLNNDKKIILSKLEKVEAERDAHGKTFDTEDKTCRKSLEDLISKAKFDAMNEVMFLISQQMMYHKKMVSHLEELQAGFEEQTEKIKDQRDCFNERIRRNSELAPKPVQTEQATYPTIGANLHLLPKLTRGLETPFKFQIVSERERDKCVDMTLDIFEKAIIMGSGQRYNVNDILRITKMSKATHMKLTFANFESRLVFRNCEERERWIETFWFLKSGLDRRLDLKTETVTATENIKILCATWNMGDAPPNWGTDPIGTWLPHGYDIYSIATQECQYTPRTGYATCQSDFYQWIGDHLGGDFVKLAGTNIMGIRIGLFVRRKFYYQINDIKCEVVATGIANVIGNKGGVCVSFTLNDKSFCFLGSHLAAHLERKRLLVRNENYRDIISRMPMSDDCQDIHNEFDYLFWMGDLNYRIEWDRDKIIHETAHGRYDEMLAKDQLLNEMQLGNCFFQFEEGQITFGPTYRFDRGTREWSEEKMREPAWCDRVLWKAGAPSTVSQLVYGPAHGLMTSDHSPVFAGFNVELDGYPIPHKRSTTYITVEELTFMPDEMMTGTCGEKFLYCSFHASWLDPEKQYLSSTSQIDSKGVANWRDVMALFPMVTNPEFFYRQWFKIVIRTKPQIDKGSALCSTTISFKDFLLDPTRHSFKVSLSERGLFCGYLKGELKFRWDEREDVPVFKEAKSRGLTRQRSKKNVKLQKPGWGDTDFQDSPTKAERSHLGTIGTRHRAEHGSIPRFEGGDVSPRNPGQGDEASRRGALMTRKLPGRDALNSMSRDRDSTSPGTTGEYGTLANEMGQGTQSAGRERERFAHPSEGSRTLQAKPFLDRNDQKRKQQRQQSREKIYLEQQELLRKAALLQQQEKATQATQQSGSELTSNEASTRLQSTTDGTTSGATDQQQLNASRERNESADSSSTNVPSTDGGKSTQSVLLQNEEIRAKLAELQKELDDASSSETESEDGELSGGDQGYDDATAGEPLQSSPSQNTSTTNSPGDSATSSPLNTNPSDGLANRPNSSSVPRLTVLGPQGHKGSPLSSSGKAPSTQATSNNSGGNPNQTASPRALPQPPSGTPMRQPSATVGGQSQAQSSTANPSQPSYNSGSQTAPRQLQQRPTTMDGSSGVRPHSIGPNNHRVNPLPLNQLGNSQSGGQQQQAGGIAKQSRVPTQQLGSNRVTSPRNLPSINATNTNPGTATNPVNATGPLSDRGTRERRANVSRTRTTIDASDELPSVEIVSTTTNTNTATADETDDASDNTTNTGNNNYTQASQFLTVSPRSHQPRYVGRQRKTSVNVGNLGDFSPAMLEEKTDAEFFMNEDEDDLM